MISISFNVILVFLRTDLIAGAGPIPIIFGSTPTDSQATTRTNGFRPYFEIAASPATNNAAAPSQIPYNDVCYNVRLVPDSNIID